jgi:hypothetical protein
VAAQRIFNAKNEAYQQPAINLQIARAYLMAVDPLVAKRSWRQVMEEIVKLKRGSTLRRWQTAIRGQGLRFHPRPGLAGNPGRAFVAGAGKRYRLDQCASAPAAQFLHGHELAAVAGHSRKAMAEDSIQRMFWGHLFITA